MEKNLLYFLMGNVDMAKVCTKQLIELSDDTEFKKQLLEDLSVYERFYNEILALKQSDEQIKDLSYMAEFSTKLSIMLKTLKDKSPAKMANMIIEGYQMGIKDIDKNIKLAQQQSERSEVIALAQRYREHIINDMESYKKFL